MIIYLLISLLFMTIIAYYLSSRDILHPMVLSSASFLFGTGLVYAYQDFWYMPFHLNSYIFILAGLFSFQIGSFIGNTVFRKEKPLDESFKEMNLPLWLPWVLTLFILICCYFNYREDFKVASNLTNSKNLNVILFTMVRGQQYQLIKTSWLYSFRVLCSKSIAYVSLYVFLNQILQNKINLLKLKNFSWIFPVFAYIIVIYLTGGRQAFLYLTIYAIFISVYLKQRSDGFDYKKSFRLLLLMLSFVGLFLILFISAGMLNGKIQSIRDLLKVLVHYGGVNITAFDTFINQISIPDTNLIGTTTLANVYDNLRKLGFDLPKLNMFITQFVRFGDQNTNVYTAFRRYIEDYGVTGFLLISFSLGTIYSGWYNWLKYRCKNGLSVILYASFCYPYFLLFREERFLTEILNGGTIKLIVTISIIYYGFLYLSKRGKLNEY